jgi:3',5'-cyclic AMP phosphodiesterase CpdA
MRIWDLRRGDDDDNRTSPYGRGLRSVVFAVVLELNYLKAPIGLLALVIVPALLVGIAPSVLVTYGRLVVHKSTLIGSAPVLALASLVVLIGAALWLARPLLAMMRLTLWHLHYSLVFPVFVALRELVRALVERVLGRSTSPGQLDRRRRLGTAVAALLLGGAGLALAAVIDVSLGLQLVDVERVRPWAVVRAALGNAAVIFGLAVAVESGYWLWRELSRKTLVLDWAPGPPRPDVSRARVAHLSDLHVVGERYGCRMEAGTHGPRGNRCIQSAFRKLATIHASTPLDRILVTGDVTDAGTRAEWAELLDLLQGFPELRARLSFVPGNHDMNIIDRANPGRLDLPWSAGTALRQLRVVLALEALQGDRAHVVDHASGALGPSLREYLHEGRRAALLRDLAKRGGLRGRWEMAKVWDAIFPLVEPPRPHDDYGLILLNSNARSHFALTNAIGVIDPSQLRAMKRVLARSPDRAWLILLHHQLVEHTMAAISLPERIGLALVNASDVLSASEPHASRIVVLHGHRHRDWIGVSGDLVVCSAPSVSLGTDAESGYRGTFNVHELAFGAGGQVRMTASERVSAL